METKPACMDWICAALPSAYFYCKSCVNVPNRVARYNVPFKRPIILCWQLVDQAGYCFEFRFRNRLCALVSSPVTIVSNLPVSSCTPLGAPAPRGFWPFPSGLCVGTVINTQTLLHSKMACSLQNIRAYRKSPSKRPPGYDEK